MNKIITSIIQFIAKLFSEPTIKEPDIIPEPIKPVKPPIEDIILPDEYSVAEKWIIRAALKLRPWGEVEGRIVELAKGRTLGGYPLDILLHALGDKESGFQLDIVAKEKSGIPAYGIYQFHETTVQPFLTKNGYTLEQFMKSVDIQTEIVIQFIEKDYKRKGNDIRGAFGQFGPGTRKIIDAIITYLDSKKK